MRYLSLLFVTALYLWAFSTSNIQYLYGDFDDNSYVFDTPDGGKSTVTLEHYRAGAYGDIFAFADVEVADERLMNGNKRNLYFEVSPRINLGSITGGTLSAGPVKNLYAAFQYNRQVAEDQEDFVAYLYGIGCDLELPGFEVFGLNGYKKNQKFADNTYQLSANYLSLNLFGTPLLLSGFTDWTEDDLLTQNQLLYDFGPLHQLGGGAFQAGTEWHWYRVKDTDVRSNTWQLMVKVVW